MKISIIPFLLFVFHLSVSAEMLPGKQIEDAKFKIVKATIEFLASDTTKFQQVKEKKCVECKDYKELLEYVKLNKITNADALINDWKKIKIDTTEANWNKSLSEFKSLVVNDIASKEKSYRKQLPTYKPYSTKLDSIIKEVSVLGLEPVESEINAQDSSETMASAKEVAPLSIVPPQENVYFNFLPVISMNMYYTIIFSLLAILVILLWIFTSKNKALQRKVKSLHEKLGKAENNEWLTRSNGNELRIVSEKLKDAEKELGILHENLNAEIARNKRLSDITPIEEQAKSNVSSIPAFIPVIKYARYADQGDGFSVQELLDEEDGETIFQLTQQSSNSASFKISSNQNAQRYALSNSPYFLGKTSIYDAFPSNNSLINTDVVGELKLQGNKWLITKPIQISFS
jgi:hypothetical protein